MGKARKTATAVGYQSSCGVPFVGWDLTWKVACRSGEIQGLDLHLALWGPAAQAVCCDILKVPSVWVAAPHIP